MSRVSEIKVYTSNKVSDKFADDLFTSSDWVLAADYFKLKDELIQIKTACDILLAKPSEQMMLINFSKLPSNQKELILQLMNTLTKIKEISNEALSAKEKE